MEALLGREKPGLGFTGGWKLSCSGRTHASNAARVHEVAAAPDVEGGAQRG